MTTEGKNEARRSAHSLRDRTPLPWSVYGSGLVVLLAGPLCAMHLLIWPGFLGLVVTLILLGLPTSLWLRARGADRAWVSRGATAAMVVAGLGFLGLYPHIPGLRGRGPSFGSSLLFSDGITPLLHFIAWVIAFRSFALLTDIDVLLMIVPGLSMIILVTLLETSTHVFLFLIPFAVSSLFLFLRHQALRLRQRAMVVVGQPAQEWRQYLRSLCSLCLVIALLATGLSVLLADLSLPKEILDRWGISLATYLSRLLITATRQPYIAISRRLDVGESPLPLGSGVVFRVTTSYPCRWRSNVFDTYNGREWQSRVEKPVVPLERQGGNPVQKVPPDPYEDYASGRRLRVDHEFHLEVYCQGVLVAAYDPVAVTIGNQKLKVDPLRRLHCSRLPAGARYRVQTSLKQISPEELRRATGTPPQAIQEAFLSLPPDLPERVRDYVRDACRGAQNPYDRLCRLARKLAATHSYTQTPPPIPEGREVVDYFLYEMKEGSCLHFASALAVLGRVAGVPTRLVTGYTPGTQNPPGGSYEVRERDAHAWVEAYLTDYGWIEFDATDQASARTSRWAERLRSFRQRLRRWTMESGQRLSSMLERLERWSGGALLLLAGVGLGLLIRRWIRVRRATASPRIQPLPVREPDPVLRHFRALCSLLRRYGLPRYDHETPFEYAAAIAACVPSIAPQVEVIVQVYVAGRYGAEPLSSEQVQASLQAWRSLPARLRGARRATPRQAWGRKENRFGFG